MQNIHTIPTIPTITATRRGWIAKYSGGCYIDLYRLGHCVANINIMDYATGGYRMEPTWQALTAELEKWLDENADNLPAYEEFARYYR